MESYQRAATIPAHAANSSTGHELPDAWPSARDAHSIPTNAAEAERRPKGGSGQQERACAVGHRWRAATRIGCGRAERSLPDKRNQELDYLPKDAKVVVQYR